MENNKTPGNDGLTKEFYECFWTNIKNTFKNSLSESKTNGSLSISQRQAVIKLLRRIEINDFIKNWRPISLLNVDTKIISKVFAEKLKETLPSLISPHQTAYVKNRCINESGKLISDIIEVSDHLVTMDIEKAFDSLDRNFLLNVLKSFGFGKNFIKWIRVLLNAQVSCVLNGGITTPYFNLERGDPISAYLFILALEVLFLLIRNHSDIKVIEIFNHKFLYTAYADDSTFLLRDLRSVKYLTDTFKLFKIFWFKTESQ